MTPPLRMRVCPDCGVTIEYGKECPHCRRALVKKVRIRGTVKGVGKVTRDLLKAGSHNKISPSTDTWISYSFYLGLLTVAGVIFLAGARMVDPLLLPIVIVGTLLAVALVGAFQLRHEKSLSEKGFLSLMSLALKQIPVILRRTSPRKATGR